jgi:hypothetical protein
MMTGCNLPYDANLAIEEIEAVRATESWSSGAGMILFGNIEYYVIAQETGRTLQYDLPTCDSAHRR